MRVRVFVLKVLALIGVAFVFGACQARGERVDTNMLDAFDLLVADLAADAAGVCTVTSNVNGVLKLQVRATSAAGTTYCSLATGERIAEQSSNAWDMSFQRFKYGTNSGTSGSGAGGACKTGATNFDGITSVSGLSGTATPDCPQFAVDKTITTASGGAGGAVQTTFNGNESFDDWYLYNIFTHVLTSRSDVFIVRSGDGTKYYRVRFTDYYNAAGTSGYPALEAVEISF